MINIEHKRCLRGQLYFQCYPVKGAPAGAPSLNSGRNFSGENNSLRSEAELVEGKLKDSRAGPNNLEETARYLDPNGVWGERIRGPGSLIVPCRECNRLFTTGDHSSGLSGPGNNLAPW